MAMNVSLDGYVDHDAFAPGPALFRHWIEQVRDVTGSVYGSRMYEIMRYWDVDDAAWGPDEQAFADAWRDQPKWVVSSQPSLDVGPNATLVPGDDLEATARRLRAELEGEVDVSGTVLAHAVGELGLVDEYRLYLHPVVLGGGTPFFAGPRPRLRFVGSEQMDDDVVRVRYVPA